MTRRVAAARRQKSRWNHSRHRPETGLDTIRYGTSSCKPAVTRLSLAVQVAFEKAKA
jgi:hypothetical protein